MKWKRIPTVLAFFFLDEIVVYSSDVISKNMNFFAARIPFNIQDRRRPLRLGCSLFFSLSALSRYRRTVYTSLAISLSITLVNILLSYISCLTEISNISKERTETAKRVQQIFLVELQEDICASRMDFADRVRPSGNAKATRIMRKM